jgi:hypothetical protein
LFLSLVHFASTCLARIIDSATLGIVVVLITLVLSFVWAFLPFKFAMMMFPALNEMHSASALCREELLRDENQRKDQADSDDVSAESCLRRMMSHVNAAGITAGRCFEVYGLVIPVRIMQIIFPFLFLGCSSDLYRSTSPLILASSQPI